MKVLIVKTSSLGDLIHTFPALTDAKQAIPAIRFDWVVEENFSEIPSWHPAVNHVIPVALRRWRKSIFKTIFGREWKRFRGRLKAEEYDLIIDAQGLIKSALITKMARGFRVGLDRLSLTEPLARFAYQKHLSVDLNQHAIHRMRMIFAGALNYRCPLSAPDYGMPQELFSKEVQVSNHPYAVFLHGTTWESKRWKESYWSVLAKMVEGKGYWIYVPWSNEREKVLAEQLASQVNAVRVLPRMNLMQLAILLARSSAVISVDTGLAHLAAALAVPVIALYGPTNPLRIGVMGRKAVQLISPGHCVFCDRASCRQQKAKDSSYCLMEISPAMIWQHLCALIN